jgi:hypothetical protein
MAEYFSTILPQSQAVAATNAVTQQVASLSLAAGEWFIGGELWVGVTAGTPTINIIGAAISIISAGPLDNPADNLAGCAYEPNQPRQTGSVTGWILPLIPIYLNLSATTLVYLNGQAAWTGAGGMQLYGKITAQGNPSGVVQGYPNFLLVHSSTDTRVGYINLNDVRWVVEEGAGSKIQVGDDQIWHVTETATYIASGGTQP